MTPMPPRPEAPGAIPLVLHAAFHGLRARHDVTLLTAAGDEPGEYEAALELARGDPSVHVVDRRRPAGLARQRRRARLAAAWLRGGRPWRTVWFAEPRLQEAIDRLADARRFDVAAVQDGAMGVFRLPPGLPRVLTEHEVQDPGGPPAAAGPPPARVLAELDRRRWASFQPGVWRRFDRVEVFTGRDADRVAELAPDVRPRVRVNPFGIALPPEADPARAEEGLVLFAGNYTHAPNVDAALWLAREIMPRVRAEVPGASLALVGPGAPPELRAAAGAGVALVGEVAAIGPWLERAAAVVAPLRLGGGMRMKVLHALAAGKAVVTTPVGAAGLLLDGGEPPLLEAGDAAGLAAATVRVLREPGLRLALGRRGRAVAAGRHSAEAYAERLEAVHAEAVAERGAAAGAAR